VPASRIYRQPGDPWYTVLWKQPIKYWWGPAPLAAAAWFLVWMVFDHAHVKTALIGAALLAAAQLYRGLLRRYTQDDGGRLEKQAIPPAHPPDK
jgi:hypothetical protein